MLDNGPSPDAAVRIGHNRLLKHVPQGNFLFVRGACVNFEDVLFNRAAFTVRNIRRHGISSGIPYRHTISSQMDIPAHESR